MFILTSSVFKTLQGLTSALTQGGEGHHLFRFTCSVVFWDGRDTANKYFWHVWGVLPVGGPHWVCHGPRQHIIPGSTLLRFQGALQEHCPRWALHFVPFPGPNCLGNWVLGKYRVPGGSCILCTYLVSATQFPTCAVRAQFQACCVSPLGS